MKSHPNSEEWMSFLYGEDAPAQHAELNAHLNQCAACRQQVQMWRGSMTALDAWNVPAKRSGAAASPVLRWAAAAAIVIGLGFGIGRATSPASIDVESLRASLQKDFEARVTAVRDDLAGTAQQHQAELVQTLHALAAQAATEESGQLIATMAKAIEAQRTADHRALIVALNQLEEQQLNGYAALRQDLDTVAVNADDGLSRAQEQLMELATLSQAIDK